MNNLEPFIFYTERRLVALTGISARNLDQLLCGLQELPGSTIFFHTHHMYVSRHFETPVFTNDFALWAAEALQEDVLAEKLTAIDLLSFTSLRRLRDEIISVIEGEVGGNGRRVRVCPPGDEFHFCKSKSFVMPTHLVATDPQSFFRILPKVSNESIFFHFFEARIRLGRTTNDFSQWLRRAGEPELASAIDRLDPYNVTLDEFKDRIIASGREHKINS
jgi:uncharacterized protein DUF5752